MYIINTSYLDAAGWKPTMKHEGDLCIHPIGEAQLLPIRLCSRRRRLRRRHPAQEAPKQAAAAAVREPELGGEHRHARA